MRADCAGMASGQEQLIKHLIKQLIEATRGSAQAL